MSLFGKTALLPTTLKKKYTVAEVGPHREWAGRGLGRGGGAAAQQLSVFSDGAGQRARWRSMGTSEAFMTAGLLTITFLATAAVIFRFWFKHASRHDEEVMLDCARKAGGPAAVRAVQKQLDGEGEGEGARTAPE